MMRKIRIIGVILLVCIVCISGCQDERSTKSQKRDKTSGLILNEKEIQREMKYLNSKDLKIYNSESNGIYSVSILGMGHIWYVNRDEEKAYTYDTTYDEWIVRIGKNGYSVTPEEVALAGNAVDIKEMNKELDNLFRFYAMINVRDNTPRMYKRGDKGFEELASYYSNVGRGKKNEITYFEVKEGKIKKSTCVYVGYRSYEESDGENSLHDYVSSDEDITTILFDVDQNSFDATYEELKQLVKTLPRNKNMSMEEKE